MEKNTNSEIILSTAAEHHQHTLELIQSANRNIFIHCHDLTPRIYNHPDIASALTQFVVKNSAQRYVRITVSDTNAIISCDHKILETCRRLSSNITIHKISKEHVRHIESFILVDDRIFILRRDYTIIDGVLVDDPKQAKELLNLFNEIWSHSQTDSELNRLYL